jgi:hypothetical protein
MIMIISFCWIKLNLKFPIFLTTCIEATSTEEVGGQTSEESGERHAQRGHAGTVVEVSAEDDGQCTEET